MITVKVGDYTLISSGSLVPPDDSPVEISFAIEPPSGGVVALIIKFVKDVANIAGRWEAVFDPQNNSKCFLTFYNFNASLGGGPKELIRLWNYNGLETYVQIRVQTYEGGAPLIQFSFYKKKGAMV